MNHKNISKITGVLYLSLVVLGPIGFLIIPELFMVDNINEFASQNLGLLVAWVLVDILIIVIEVFISLYLFKLLQNYGKNTALAISISRFLIVVIMIVNVVFLLVPLFGGGANADTFIGYHNDGVYVWQIPFSIHVGLLGYMALKTISSKWRYLGPALILGGLGYLLDSIKYLANIDSSLLENFTMILLVFVMIGEIGIAIGFLLHKVWNQDIVS